MLYLSGSKEPSVLHLVGWEEAAHGQFSFLIAVAGIFFIGRKCYGRPPNFHWNFSGNMVRREKKPQHTQRTVHQTFCILALIHKNYFQISYYFTVHEVTRRNSECLTAAVPDCHLQRWFFIFVWWKSFTCKLNTSFPRCWYNKSHFMPVFL